MELVMFKRVSIFFSLIMVALLLSGCFTYNKYRRPPRDANHLVHDGLFRSWEMFVPEGIEEKVPLLVDMHGYAMRPGQQRRVSKFEELAKEEQFIAVWPEGLYRSWNSGTQCCDPAENDGLDDVGFIRALVEKVAKEHPVDLSRVYATGLSNGSAMSQRLAIEAGDLFAATASMSFFLLIEDPEPGNYNPIPVMFIHGTNDMIVPYHTSHFPGAQDNFERWKSLNNCTDVKESWREGKNFALTATGGENSAEVTFVTVDNGPHLLYPPLTGDVNTTRIAWDFLTRFYKSDGVTVEAAQ